MQVAAVPTVAAHPAADEPSVITVAQTRLPKDRTVWQKARLRMKRRILSLAKTESNPLVRRRLITLSTRVLKDRNTSIEARLVKTLHNSPNFKVKRYVNDILSDYAPHRAISFSTVAMR